MSFGISALIVLTWVKPPGLSPRPEGAGRPSLWSVSADGVRVVFGHRVLLTLLLFGWLAGFYIVPEGLAGPYARSLHGGTLTVGMLMAAMPLGVVMGAFLLSRVAAPSVRLAMMGWLAVLSCAPLIGCAWSPPLWAVLLLWAGSGAGGAYQLAVGLAALVGLTAATMLAMSWTHLRVQLIRHSQPGRTTPLLIDQDLGVQGTLSDARGIGQSAHRPLRGRAVISNAR